MQGHVNILPYGNQRIGRFCGGRIVTASLRKRLSNPPVLLSFQEVLRLLFAGNVQHDAVGLPGRQIRHDIQCENDE
jgi:hypothetical protein